MSWQDQAKRLLIGNYVQKGLICDHKGYVWGQTEHFLTQKDIMEINNFLTKKSSTMFCMLSNGTSCYAIKITDRSVYCKCDDDSGICFTKTKQAFIIGWYDKRSCAGHCNYSIEYYAGSYISMGY
eukprot:gene4101-7389_t